MRTTWIIAVMGVVLLAGILPAYANCGGGCAPPDQTMNTVCPGAACGDVGYQAIGNPVMLTADPACGMGCQTMTTKEEFTAATNYMSLCGYLRWQTYLASQDWVSRETACTSGMCPTM